MRYPTLQFSLIEAFDLASLTKVAKISARISSTVLLSVKQTEAIEEIARGLTLLLNSSFTSARSNLLNLPTAFSEL